MKTLFFRLFFLLFFVKTAASQEYGRLLFADDFSKKNDGRWQFLERGKARISGGVLRVEDCLAVAGDEQWKNYELRFRARSLDANVQIWAGLRCLDRDQRFAFAMRGGNHDDLWLARYGYLGTDEFLAIRPLEFHPKKKEWRRFRIQVFENVVSVFLEDETLPRIQIQDTTKWLPTGKIVLGGGWLPVEFDDVEVREILSQNADFKEFTKKESAAAKARRRVEERKNYRSLFVKNQRVSHQETSLDGDWLFLPDYENLAENFADPAAPDTGWHLLEVPNFWNENRVWLHGEDAGMRSGDKGVSDNFRQLEIARCEGYTYDYQRVETGFYRRWVWLDSSFFSGPARHFRLQFDAVSKIGELWVNGHFAGRHVGMFGEFSTDISKWLRPGANLIAVKVIRNYLENTAAAQKVEDVAVTVEITKKMLSDLPHGIFAKDPAGIWQPVKLVISNPTHFQDVFFKPNLSGAEVDLEIKTGDAAKHDFSVEIQLKNLSDNSVFYSKTGIKIGSAGGGGVLKKTVSIAGLAPKLWSPEEPNLYQLNIKLIENGLELDEFSETVGFRTFETRGDYFYLNNKPYRMRGANHSPMSIRPNDAALAEVFMKKMHEGGMLFTRTTTSPFSKIWMQAADKQGVAVSFEGQWPWLMMRGDIPDERLLDFWQKEYLDLIRKYKNHPSLLIWTINNEMKFYEKDTVKVRLQKKFRIISDFIREIRKIDPTRPIVFDSGYRRDSSQIDKNFIKTIDDGDADDVHSYVNWYYYSIFDYFAGNFTKWYKNPGRPLISQEFSSGYPNNDGGHAVRAYPFSHFVGQPQVGRAIFEDHDPQVFLDFQAFIAKESHEAVRRSSPTAAGLQHFSSICWFKDVYDARRLKPYPTYHAMKIALQPLLISAEIWGRNFYAGDTARIRVCLINDDIQLGDLKTSVLRWRIENDGKAIIKGIKKLPPVDYFSQGWDSLSIPMPHRFKGEKIKARLVLEVFSEGNRLSFNEYSLLIGKRPERVEETQAFLFDSLNRFSSDFNNSFNLKKLSKPAFFKSLLESPRAGKFVMVADQIDTAEFRRIKSAIELGAKIVFLGSAEKMKTLFPEFVDSIYRQPGEIISMVEPESPFFEGIEPMELRYFNNGKQERPLSHRESLYVSPKQNARPLLQFTVVHGYINLAFHVRHERVREFTGFPLVRLKIGSGEAMLCTLLLEKAVTDPVLGQLLRNLLVKF